LAEELAKVGEKFSRQLDSPFPVGLAPPSTPPAPEEKGTNEALDGGDGKPQVLIEQAKSQPYWLDWRTSV
jgi:hypothetical protein